MKQAWLIAVTCALAALACTSVFAADAPAAPAAGAPAGAPPGAMPRPPAAPPKVRPAPCILPALRMVDVGMVDTIANSVELTDEQKKKITELLTRAEDDRLPLIEAQRKAAGEFVDMITKPDATQASVTAATDKFMKAETAIMNDRIKTYFAVRAMLTPEQMKPFDDMVKTYTTPWKPREFRPTMVAPPPPVAPHGGAKPPAGGK